MRGEISSEEKKGSALYAESTGRIMVICVTREVMRHVQSWKGCGEARLFHILLNTGCEQEGMTVDKPLGFRGVKDLIT